MKKSTFIPAALMLASAFSFQAQNKVNITLLGGATETFNTTDVESIDIDGGRVTVNPLAGDAKVYDGTVSGISFLKSVAGTVNIIEAGGWFETTYVKWENMTGADNYMVYVKGVNDPEYRKLDYQLVRNYGSYGRADMPGLKEGQYIMKVVPVMGGTQMEGMASETAVLNVKAHDRGGFAHFNYSQGVGAYKNDGTLKDGAKVIYVTADNCKTISTDIITSSKGNVETFTGFQNIIYGYQKGYDKTPIAFRIIGRIDRSDLDDMLSSAEGIQIKGKSAYAEMNITIEGIGDDAVIHNFGFLLRNTQSVEMRNFAIMYFMDDAVSMDTDNSHLWIHNLDIFYGEPGGDSDQAKGDGTLDLKGDTQYVTLAYNHLWDSGKASLCGMKSESGPNYITYHHNWFDHSDSRHPRIRTMSVHVYNNYYDGVSKYGIGAAMSSEAFVEANYFRDCKYPMLISLQGSDVMGEGSTPSGKGTFSGEDGGVIKAYNNVLTGWYFYRPWSENNTVEFDAYEVTDRNTTVPSSIKAKSGGRTYSNFDTNSSLMYAYTPDAPEQIPSIVKGTYGAGRINHGDFHWTFNNNLQDKDYNVISALSTAIQNYRNTLVGFYEGSTSFGDKAASRFNGGDSTEGDEYPFGNGNAAMGSVGGGGGGSTDPVENGDIFMANADGTDYFWFNADNAAQTNTWLSDGTITVSEGGSFVPDYSGTESVPSNYTGAIGIPKEGGTMVISCPSISVFKVQLLRTGSYKGSIELSTDGGATWTTVSTLNQKKGNVELDLSSALKSAGPALVRITNTSTGNLNVHGLYILKAK